MDLAKLKKKPGHGVRRPKPFRRAANLNVLKRRSDGCFSEVNRRKTVCICFILAVLSVTSAVGALGVLYNVALGTAKLTVYANQASLLLSEPLYSPEAPMTKPDLSETEAASDVEPDKISEEISGKTYVSETENGAESDSVSENLIATRPLDLSYPSLGEWYYSNETGYSPDLGSLVNAAYPVEAPSYSAMSARGSYGSDSPLVLILHTHATEAFSDSSDALYPADYTVPRSNDTAKNIVAVGEVMSDILNASGIPTLHCTILHDGESYVRSYENSRETILEYLERYPSIKYIFDVHRDSINTSDGAVVRSICGINGVETAQVMSVVGTDYKGGEHPDWTKNLTLAVKLKARLDEKYPSLCRPINLRCATFNEQYADGSLLLEVGSAGNTLDEAKRAGVLLASEIAVLINENR